MFNKNCAIFGPPCRANGKYKKYARYVMWKTEKRTDRQISQKQSIFADEMYNV